MAGTAEFHERLQSIEKLLGNVEGAADPHLRASMRELVQSLMDLHSAGLERILDLIGSTDDGPRIISKLGNDDLVGSLLVLYGLHPLSLEARINRGVDRARTLLRARAGELEILSLEDGALRLRVRAEGHGCGSGPAALKEIVEAAVYGAAPDITMLMVETEEDKQSFVPLAMLRQVPVSVLAGAAKGEL